jgi:solute carrier family 35 protein E1
MDSASPATANGGLSKFPAFAPDSLSHYGSDDNTRRSTSSPDRGSSSNPPLTLRQSLEADSAGPRFQPPFNWQARRSSRAPPGGARRGHGRQRSLSEAIQVIRGRNGSMSQNAAEIADALKAPVSPRLVVSSGIFIYLTRRETMRRREC